MTQTLEQQLTALCEAHGLSEMMICFRPDGTVFGYAHGGELCASPNDYSLTSAAEVIKLAIKNLNAKRYAVEVADLAPVDGLAA